MSSGNETGAREPVIDAAVASTETAITAPPADQQPEYHRMASKPGSPWWLPIVATVALLAIGFACQFIVGLGVFAAAALTDVIDEAFLDVVVSFAAIGAFLPAFFLAARVWRRRGGELSSVAGRIRWKWLLLCAAIAVPAFPLHLVLVTMLSAVAEPAMLEAPPIDPAEPTGLAATTITTIVVLLLVVPCQAAAEEYFMRGWLVQVFGAYLRTPWVGVGIGAVVFVLLHGEGTVAGYAALLTFGLVLGWLVVRTGGLEAGIAFHVVWNLTIAVLAVLAGDTDSESNLGDSPWPVLVGQLIVMPLYAFIIAKLATRKRLLAA